jgi:hypothetical protein
VILDTTDENFRPFVEDDANELELYFREDTSFPNSKVYLIKKTAGGAILKPVTAEPIAVQSVQDRLGLSADGGVIEDIAER